MRSVARGGSSGPADLVRTLTKFGRFPKVVRVLTTFGPLRLPVRHLPHWHGHLHQFCPSQKASKTVHTGARSDQIRARKEQKTIKKQHVSPCPSSHSGPKTSLAGQKQGSEPKKTRIWVFWQGENSRKSYGAGGMSSKAGSRKAARSQGKTRTPKSVPGTLA